jgi:hypothetical protein
LRTFVRGFCSILTALYGPSTVAGNQAEGERGMSTIDRRAFVVGCLVIPVAGCGNPNSTSFTDQTPLLLPAKFRNYGHPRVTGDTPVFVVTGGIKP